MNQRSGTPALRFDPSINRAYGQWWAMVDVVGRWMCVGGRGRGYKMEADDGEQTGHSTKFSIPKSYCLADEIHSWRCCNDALALGEALLSSYPPV